MDNIKVYKQLNSLEELEELGYSYGQPEVEVYSRLKEVLEEKELDTSDLANITGISRQTFHGILRKNRRISVDVALKLSYVLNVPVDELFYLSENCWFTLVCDSEDLSLYIDHLKLQLINGKGKKVIQAAEGDDTYVNIDTKEAAPVKKLSKEDLASEKWRPRFERIIKYIEPIQF